MTTANQPNRSEYLPLPLAMFLITPNDDVLIKIHCCEIIYTPEDSSISNLWKNPLNGPSKYKNEGSPYKREKTDKIFGFHYSYSTIHVQNIAQQCFLIIRQTSTKRAL